MYGKQFTDLRRAYFTPYSWLLTSVAQKCSPARERRQRGRGTETIPHCFQRVAGKTTERNVLECRGRGGEGNMSTPSSWRCPNMTEALRNLTQHRRRRGRCPTRLRGPGLMEENKFWIFFPYIYFLYPWSWFAECILQKRHNRHKKFCVFN